LYSIPATGGQPTLLARGGRNPRFSPGGEQIAFWTGLPGPRGGGKIFLVPPKGGSPVPIASPFASAHSPIWSPDGKWILFVGQRTISDKVDWWVVEPGSMDPRATGAVNAKSNLTYGPPWTWAAGNRILFEGHYGHSKNIWSVELDRSFRPRGQPERVTASSASESQPVLTPDGRLVFASLESAQSLWSLPLDAGEGKALGPFQMTLRTPELAVHPAVSAAGSRIAYVTERLGVQGTFLFDAATGADRRLSTVAQSWSPIVSRDGSLVAYLSVAAGQGQPQILISLNNGASLPCDACERLYAFSPDNRRVMLGGRVSRNNPQFLAIQDLSSGKSDRILGWPEYNISSADWSPDGRWIAVASRNKDGHPEVWITGVDAKERYRVTEELRFDDRPRYSPDGRILYFLSERDGYRCLWARRLADGRPSGPAWAVEHVHSTRRSMLSVLPNELDLAIARDRAIVVMKENRSELWVVAPY
jgi:Tol biopolymer transport system component